MAGGCIAQAVLRPAVLDFVEDATGKGQADLQLEEQLVRPGSALDGKTVGTSGLRSWSGADPRRHQAPGRAAWPSTPRTTRPSPPVTPSSPWAVASNWVVPMRWPSRDSWSSVGAAGLGAVLGGLVGGFVVVAVTLVLKAGMDFCAAPAALVRGRGAAARAGDRRAGAAGAWQDGDAAVRHRAAAGVADVSTGRDPGGHQRRRRRQRGRGGAIPLAPGADSHARHPRDRRLGRRRWGPRRRRRISAWPPARGSAIAAAGGAGCCGPPPSPAARRAWPR